MMKPRRRMTFQIDSAADLLLIVIFAQYMEVQQKAESAQSDLQEQKQQLVQQFDEGQAALERKRLELERQISKQSASLTETREQYSKQFESILRQHQQAGQTLAEAFNLPGNVMEEILRLKTDGNSTDAANLEKAAERLKRMLPERGEELLQFMLRYDEMQKHVSVWELHVQDNGQASFSDGEQSQRCHLARRKSLSSERFKAASHSLSRSRW